MATTPEQSFVQTFESSFLHEYKKRESLLSSTVTEHKIEGDSTRVTVFGDMQMKPHNAGTQVTTEIIPSRNINIPVADFQVSTELYKLDLKKTNQDLIAAATKTLTSSALCKKDQLIIDALDGLTYTAGTDDATKGDVVAVNLSGTNDDMTVAKVAAATKIFRQRTAAVPGGSSLLLSPSGVANMITTEDKFTSKDYTNKPAMDEGDKSYFYGHQFVELGNNGLESGLPITSNNIRSNFLYNKEAVHLAFVAQPTFSINYLAEKLCHLVTVVMSMGVQVVLPAGVVKILTDES